MTSWYILQQQQQLGNALYYLNQNIKGMKGSGHGDGGKGKGLQNDGGKANAKRGAGKGKTASPKAWGSDPPCKWCGKRGTPKPSAGAGTRYAMYAEDWDTLRQFAGRHQQRTQHRRRKPLQRRMPMWYKTSRGFAVRGMGRASTISFRNSRTQNAEQRG